MTSAKEYVLLEWSNFRSAQGPESTTEDDMAAFDGLHGAFLVSFLTSEKLVLLRTRPRLQQETEEPASSSSSTSAQVSRSGIDAEWLAQLAQALRDVILLDAGVDLRELMMQLEALSSSGGGSAVEECFVRCDDEFCSLMQQQDEDDEWRAQVWSRCMLMCSLVGHLVALRRAQASSSSSSSKQRAAGIGPWITLFLGLLRIDDYHNAMPASYLSSLVALLSDLVRCSHEDITTELLNHEQAKKEGSGALVVVKPSTRVAASLLLSASLKLAWHHKWWLLRRAAQTPASDHNNNYNSKMMTSSCCSEDDVRALVVAAAKLRVVTHSGDDHDERTTSLTHLSILMLSAELGTLRTVVASASSTHERKSCSRRGNPPPELQSVFLQRGGDLFGALSTAACNSSAGSVRRENDNDEHDDGDSSRLSRGEEDDDDAGDSICSAEEQRRRGRIMAAAAEHKERLAAVKEKFQFVSSSDDDDHDDDVRQCVNRGAGDDGDVASRIHSFLGSGGGSSSSSLLSTPCCCLADPLAAAGWIAFLLGPSSSSSSSSSTTNLLGELSSQLHHRNDKRHHSTAMLLLLLTGLVHAIRVIQQSAASTNGSSLVIITDFVARAVRDVPLYSIACERILVGDVKRLFRTFDGDFVSGFLLKKNSNHGGGGGGGEESSPSSVLVRTVRDAVVTARSAVGEVIAVTMQSLAWSMGSGDSQQLPTAEMQQQHQRRYMQAMNGMLQRCEEQTRFKIVASLILLSPQDGFSSTFLAAMRFCMEEDLRLIEETDKKQNVDVSNNNGIKRHDLRSPFLDGALVVVVLCAAIDEWSRGFGFWFAMKSESCVSVLQLIQWLRVVDNRLKRLGASLFAKSSSSSSSSSSGGDNDHNVMQVVNRASIQCAKDIVIDKIRSKIKELSKSSSQKKGVDGGSSDNVEAAPVVFAPQSQLSDLQLYQLGTFLDSAVSSLNFLASTS